MLLVTLPMGPGGPVKSETLTAVDGVTTLQAMTVDGLPVARHHAKLAAIRAAAG